MIGKIMGFLGLEDEEITEEEGSPENSEILSRRKNKNKNNNNVLSIHSQKSMKLMLHEPGSYEETQPIADHLRLHRPVIVNLQRLDADTARRVIDFLSGCVYALNGEIKKIGTSIFLCSPENVDIQGNITENIHEEY